MNDSELRCDYRFLIEICKKAVGGSGENGNNPEIPDLIEKTRPEEVEVTVATSY
jgi:hypothetical protein